MSKMIEFVRGLMKKGGVKVKVEEERPTEI